MTKFARLIILVVPLLTGCAAVSEMATTGEPPESWTNLYSAGTKIVTRPALVRKPWNYGAGILSSITNGGIDLTVEEPSN